MGTVIRIDCSSRNPNRVIVRLDSGGPLALWADVAAGLRVGQDLSAADIDRLCKAEVTEDAYQRALRLLSFRSRSETEIRRYLHKRGVDATSTERAITRLRSSRLADDTQFARTWVENRATFRPRSRRALAWELRSKGVAAAEIEAAVADVDDAEMALQAALQYAHRLQGYSWPDFRRKVHAYLTRRGFPNDLTSAAVDHAWKEATDGHPIPENEEVT